MSDRSSTEGDVSSEAPGSRDAFPVVSLHDWRARVTADLRDRDLDEALGRDVDGMLRTRPLYAPGETSAVDAGAESVAGSADECAGDAAWRFASLIDAGDPDDALRFIEEDRRNDVEVFWLRLDRPERLHRPARPDDPPKDGIGDLSSRRLGEALKVASAGGRSADGRALVLDAGAAPAAALEWVLRALDAAAIDPSDVEILLGADAAGSLARDGALPGPLETIDREIVALVSRLRGVSPRGRTCAANALPYHLAGAGYAEAIGFALASAVRTLRILIANGVAPTAAAAQVAWTLPVTGDLLVSLASLRATRHLWGRVTASLGAAPTPTLIHAVTSTRMLARLDPRSNALRLTNASVAAVLGGANLLSISAYDAALEIAPAAVARGRRLARNTSLILGEEAYLHEVIDPTGGSWCIEALTDRIARDAYCVFQEIERGGGIIAALVEGVVGARCEASAATRRSRIASRRDVIVGVNQFAVVHEPDPPEFAQASGAGRPAVADALRFEEAAPVGLTIDRLSIRRDTESFEALREVSAALARAGQRPRVALVGVGPFWEWKARADFVADLLAAGGVEAIWPVSDEGAVNDFAADPDLAVARFRETQIEVACLCAADARVHDSGAAVVRALKAAGARVVLVAGRPGASASSLAEAGATDFVHVGVDACQLVTKVITKMHATTSPPGPPLGPPPPGPGHEGVRS